MSLPTEMIRSRSQESNHFTFLQIMYLCKFGQNLANDLEDQTMLINGPGGLEN